MFIEADQALFGAINSLAGRSSVLDHLAVFGARYLIFMIVLLAFCLVFVSRVAAQRRLNLKIVIGAALSAGWGYLIDLLIAALVNRPRPFTIGLGHDIYSTMISSSSFPSRHTTIAFALATMVFLGHKKFGAALLILAALVGLSRVFVGVHYPVDIIAGMLIGAGVAYLVAKFLLPIFKAKVNWSDGNGS